jgi:FixJ family two-component response regulator
LFAPGKNSLVVFVVDDDISVRESIELLIRNAGWQVEFSRDEDGIHHHWASEMTFTAP